ncbi:MAG: endonuclease/exonuclease/phosphatase family protein [Paracoccaceae bacterium]
MCLNAWGGRLHGPLMDYLGQSQPDILCLQEVVHTPDAPSAWLEYRDLGQVLPQRADVLGDVSAALPDHVAVFCPAARGPLWQGDHSYDSYWGLATWVHRRLIIVAQQQGFVHGGFGTGGFGDHPRSRTGHAVRVFDPVAHRFVMVAQMHGLRDLSGKQDMPIRRAQAHRFAALARSVAQPGDARVVCGDFNVLRNSETLDILRAEGLRDCVTDQGWPGTRTASYPKPERFADYLLTDADGAFEVVYDPEVSDHCPLVLRL